MSSVRRVFYYLITLIALGILAGGAGVLISLLGNWLFRSAVTIGEWHFNRQQLSLGIAMVIIGGPLWAWFWYNLSRQVNHQSVEIGATTRKLFLNLILTASVLTSVIAGENFFKAWLGGQAAERGAAGNLATLAVALGIWVYHWKVSEQEGHPSNAARTLRRWYIYIASGYGLVWFCVAVVQLVAACANLLPFWGGSLISSGSWGRAISANVPAIVFSGALWAFHWFKMASADLDSTLRQVYLYLLAISGSAIAGLVAFINGVYKTLAWALGAAPNVQGVYFQYLTWTIPTLAVSLGIWLYHQTLAREESGQVEEKRLSAKRVHYYIMSFLGLGTLTAGLVILIGLILNLIVNSLDPAIAIQNGWWQKQLALSLSLLIAALPLWWYYWNRIIGMADQGGIIEWRARSRRIYLYSIVAASFIALAAALVNLVYQCLSTWMAGNSGIELLNKCRWSLQSILVALPILIYHWQTARRDQHRGAESGLSTKRISALVNTSSVELIERLEKQLGTAIRVLEYNDEENAEGTPAISDEQLATTVSEIRAGTAPQVMLIVRGGEIRILPYREKK
jgi:ABC-type multidrug transport system fused ATPase/permease subunit